MDATFFETRGVDMDKDTEFLKNRGPRRFVDMDMNTVWNRCPLNAA